MIVTHFSQEYLKPVAKLCRQNMDRDIMPDFLLNEKTFGDPDYDPELTLVGKIENRELPIAFIQGVVRKRADGKVGYIKLLCVDSNERRKGHARMLYENVEKVYFSPRLATERLRIAKLVKKNESVLVMFSGSGAYPLVIAKNSNPNIIYGIEVNPIAHKYAEQNIFLNKITFIYCFWSNPPRGRGKNIKSHPPALSGRMF